MLALGFIAACMVLLAGYKYYGKCLTKWLDIDPDRAVPSHELRDGVDYLPTNVPVLFGHHFSSIAGAGPIVGPVLAALAFGWLPALLWVLAGSILIGGVHDYVSLVASIRNRGRSIGEMCRLYLSPLTYRIFLLFIWFTLVYVIVVFLDLTADTFAGAGNGGSPVATASVFYILIALLFGLAVHKWKLPFGIATVIFVPLVFLGLAIGYAVPLHASKDIWLIVLLAYCFAASIAPVWVLLQPRDYLSSFLLYACLLLGAAGLLVSGALSRTSIAYPAFTGWTSPQNEFLFPALFITVACGAVSGFHSIVASGTTAKQLDRETDALPVAYGSMIVEGVLALIALATVVILSRGEGAGLTPVQLFARGLGTFAGVFGIPPQTAQLFGILAVSTFLLTTLDTATRLTRFIIQEFFAVSGNRWRCLSTLATLVLPAVFVFYPVGAGQPSAWKMVWPAFGTTNQLLAALALLVVYVWMTAAGYQRRWFVLLPMLFMLATAGASLVLLVQANLVTPLLKQQVEQGNFLIGSICAVLLVLAGLVVGDTLRLWYRAKPLVLVGTES